MFERVWIVLFFLGREEKRGEEKRRGEKRRGDERGGEGRREETRSGHEVTIRAVTKAS